MQPFKINAFMLLPMANRKGNGVTITFKHLRRYLCYLLFITWVTDINHLKSMMLHLSPLLPTLLV